MDACTTPRTSSLSGLCAVDREEDGGAVEIKRRIGERRRRKNKERDRELGGRGGSGVCRYTTRDSVSLHYHHNYVRIAGTGSIGQVVHVNHHVNLVRNINSLAHRFRSIQIRY